MKLLLSALFTATIFLFSSTAASALPTPAKSEIIWDMTDTTGIVGYYIYFRSDAAGTTYNDTNKFQVPNVDARNAFIVDITPQRNRLCLVATAYNALGEESGFSNEVCDFFGLFGPINARVQ